MNIKIILFLILMCFFIIILLFIKDSIEKANIIRSNKSQIDSLVEETNHLLDMCKYLKDTKTTAFYLNDSVDIVVQTDTVEKDGKRFMRVWGVYDVN